MSKTFMIVRKSCIISLDLFYYVVIGQQSASHRRKKVTGPGVGISIGAEM